MQTRGAASARFEVLLARAFTVALLAISIEILINFWLQLSALNAPVAFLAIGLLLASQLSLVASAWLGSARRLWLGLHALLSLAILLSWPLQVGGGASYEHKPWIWWSLGIASLSAAIAWPNFASWLYLLINPVAWLVVSSSAPGGAASLDIALRDASYLLLFPAVLAALLWLLRSRVAAVDEAIAESLAKTVVRAQTDAVEREQSRLDGLIHDQVLHALLAAVSAKTSAERQTAVNLAEVARLKLQDFGASADQSSSVSASGLMRSLRKAVSQMNPRVTVELSSSASYQVPAEVAEAVTFAAIQAVENALQHARADSIALQLHADRSALSVNVIDDGRGFRLDSISRNRLGLQTSIIKRMKLVGGEADVSSTPGAGTRVELRWSP